MKTRIKTVKIVDEKSRSEALKVIEKVYLKEKKWISDLQLEIPEDIASSKTFSWFLTYVNYNPSGVLRLFYDPPLELPKDFEVTLEKGIDIEAMSKNARFVEIGRFMVLPRYRRNIMVALRLMRSAIKEVVERDYTHFITDVFEGEENSPLGFHTRILGFEVIGKHLHGDLNCSLTRIILTLDILKAYKKVKERQNKIYKILNEDVRSILDKKLEAGSSAI